MTVLTAAEVSEALGAIERDGFVHLPGIVPREELVEFADHLAAEYRAARERGELFDGGGSFSGHLNCFPGERSRFIHEALVDAGVLDIVAARSPDRVDEVRATTNYNLPGSSAQHYHPDGLYVEEFLICNIAVVDTDLENGAIDLLPGTHTSFHKFWQYARDRLYRRSTRIPMRAGDVLVRLSTVWHRGMPNTTDRPRPMMSLTFGEASAPPGDPFAINDGRVVFTPNWYGTDRTSQLRERLFVSQPWIYSSLRFGRSLFGDKGYSSW